MFIKEKLYYTVKYNIYKRVIKFNGSCISIISILTGKAKLVLISHLIKDYYEKYR